VSQDFLPNWKFNTRPFQPKVALLVTSWMGHLKWMKYTFGTYKATGAFVLLAMDTHLKFDDYQPNLSVHLPPADVLVQVDAFVAKHATWDADKRNGWLWNLLYAAPILLSFPNIEHILTINSDCALDRPEGLPELIELLGDGDFMSQSVDWDGDHPKSIHTCSMLFKREAFARVAEYFRTAMMTAGPESYSPELLLGAAHQALGLKLQPTPQCPIFPDGDFKGAVDHYSSYAEESTWKSVLGFRNLCAENDTAGIERRAPLPAKYFDLRNEGDLLPGYERDTLFLYYRTGDRRHLWRWYDEDEDSWYDRRKYPVEHYGPDPVLA
jgi:hypothetical protein